MVITGIQETDKGNGCVITEMILVVDALTEIVHRETTNLRVGYPVAMRVFLVRIVVRWQTRWSAAARASITKLAGIEVLAETRLSNAIPRRRR